MEFSKNYKGEGDFINDKDEGLTYGRFGNSVQLIGCDMCPGGYVFCTAGQKLEMAAIHRDMSPKYDDCYSIVNVPEFHRELGILVFESLKATDVNFDSYFGTKVSQDGKVAINDHGIACMRCRSEIEYNKDQRTSFRTLDRVSIIRFTHFSKPEEYQYQKEYRFLYIALGPDGTTYLNLKSDQALFVNTSRLLKFFRGC